MNPDPHTREVQLRAVERPDLDRFFLFQMDEESNRMAAFVGERPGDRVEFDAHWEKMLSDSGVCMRTVLWRGLAVGYVARFELFGKPSLAYWIGREYWGRGIATSAVREFLRALPERPLYARVASDNVGSIRVLEKAGFTREGRNRGFANARGAEIEESVFRIDRT